MNYLHRHSAPYFLSLLSPVNKCNSADHYLNYTHLYNVPKIPWIKPTQLIQSLILCIFKSIVTKLKQHNTTEDRPATVWRSISWRRGRPSTGCGTHSSWSWRTCPSRSGSRTAAFRREACTRCNRLTRCRPRSCGLSCRGPPARCSWVFRRGFSSFRRRSRSWWRDRSRQAWSGKSWHRLSNWQMETGSTGGQTHTKTVHKG